MWDHILLVTNAKNITQGMQHFALDDHCKDWGQTLTLSLIFNVKLNSKSMTMAIKFKVMVNDLELNLTLNIMVKANI